MDVSDPATAVLAAGTAAVLRALAGADAQFTVRQLARVADVSTNRAHQVITKLAEHGLVLTEDQGSSKLCRLNREHLAAGPVIALVQLRAEMINLLKRELTAWPSPPENASLFGSAARGDGTTRSDLDVLIVRPNEVADDDPRWLDQASASSERISVATGNDVAWFDISQHALGHALRTREPIVAEWRRDAITLFGTDLRVLLKDLS